MLETQTYTPKSAQKSNRPGYYTPTITPGLVAQLRNVTGGIWSPDGHYFFYVVDWDARADIFRLDLEDGSVLQVTSDFQHAPVMMLGQSVGAFDFSLSPDGKTIVYASQKDGRAHLIDSDGGITRPLSLGEGGQSQVAFSPDGTKVAFLTTFGDTQSIAVTDAKGGGWPTLVSDPEFFNFAPRWFPDSKKLVYFEYDSHTMPHWESRLVVADLESDEKTIIFDGLGRNAVSSYSAGDYAVSPDGTKLAYVNEESGWGNLVLYDLVTGLTKPLVSEAAEHHTPVWSPDGSKIAYLKSQHSRMTVELVTLSGEQTTVAGGDVVCSYPAFSPDGSRLSYVSQSSNITPNIWAYSFETGETSPLTSYKLAGYEEKDLVKSEVVHWTGANGLEIEGILTKPKNLQPGKHPFLLYVHGGPIMQYNLRFEPSVQYWVDRGWVVLQPNFRGSTGYGRDFRRALLNTWGQEDMQDSMAGIDYVIGLGLIDPAKVVSWGLSGGGYATLRLLTGWPDRFKAGVDLEGVSNLVSFPEQVDRFCQHLIQDFLGYRHENLALYEERSPTYHAAEIKAPLMILMGDMDLRVPAKQGEEMVEALEKAGKKDYEYHLYPGEAHGWRRSVTIKDYHERMEKFLTKWVLER